MWLGAILKTTATESPRVDQTSKGISGHERPSLGGEKSDKCGLILSGGEKSDKGKPTTPATGGSSIVDGGTVVAQSMAKFIQV